MTYSFPLTNFFTIFRQPTGLAIIASVGIHGIVGVGLEQVPILSKHKEISPVQLVELTPEQLSFLPEFSQPEMAAMNFDTLVPPSPGDAGSGLPAVPPAMEPLEPWTLPEGSSLYNSDKPLATIPSLENSPPAFSKNNSPTQTPKTPQTLPSPSPWEELLSQLPPPPPFIPSNNQYNESNQLPQQQLYTVPTAPASPPELPGHKLRH